MLWTAPLNRGSSKQRTRALNAPAACPYLWIEIPEPMADVLDAFPAYAVGFITAAVMLSLFAIIETGTSADELIGKISVQAVPASIGAMLARSHY